MHFPQTEIIRSDEILDDDLTMKEVCRIYGLYSKVRRHGIALLTNFEFSRRFIKTFRNSNLTITDVDLPIILFF